MKNNKLTYKENTFNNLTELRWAIYFDEVGIEYEFKQKEVDIQGMGMDLELTFFLPEYGMWVIVGHHLIMDTYFAAYDYFTHVLKKSVIIIKGTPDFRPYPVLAPGKKMEHINLIPVRSEEDSQFIKDELLNSEEDYHALGSAGIEAAKAIEIAQDEDMYSSKDYLYKGQRYCSLLDYGWARYFDEMGISYTTKIQAQQLPERTITWPEFYLPDYKIWCVITLDMIGAFEYENAKALCLNTQKPVLLLEDTPTERYYSMLMPEEDGHYDVQITNVIPNGKGLLTGVFLKGRDAFKSYGEQGKKAADVIIRVKADVDDKNYRH